MDALRNKAIQQQERVAERSRLRNSGMLEPHKTQYVLAQRSLVLLLPVLRQE